MIRQYNGIQTSLAVRGGGNASTKNLAKKHFPDFEECVNFQNQQAKLYQSGLNRLSEGRRTGVARLDSMFF
jgi:hypothetical protein